MSVPPVESFVTRHLGPRPSDVVDMLAAIGMGSLDDLIDATVPAGIRLGRDLDLPTALNERECIARMKEYADDNDVWRSYLGFGYHDTVTPPVILRNLLENPSWYTAYTPYQAEISQGRMEALLIYQTVVQDLTGMEMANASMLDEATAAAEALAMCHRDSRGKRGGFFVSELCHPQTIEVVKTRAAALGIDVAVGDVASLDFSSPVCGVLVQYPATQGGVHDYRRLCTDAHAHKAMVVMASDLLALTLLESPGALGADVCVGSAQRFGVPLGYGGPHAAFLACRESFKRTMPGRIIGISRDADGNQALRMALQTREQHIRRQKATSNICTAQVLLANIAGMYAVWHGPEGLRTIARRVHGLACSFAAGLRDAGIATGDAPIFDTVVVTVDDASAVIARAAEHRINLRAFGHSQVIVALDEATGPADIDDLLAVFGAGAAGASDSTLPESWLRTDDVLADECFHAYRSETEMMRFLRRLSNKDLALDTAMIPLGSCTMKLNAATQMIPITWRGFGGMHPFAPVEQASGYTRLFNDLETWLAEITGFAAVSLQPNAGSQGEYAGLLTIAGYHRSRGDMGRDICIIPTSAHGTNPASAVMAGMKVVAVACDDEGNIDVADLQAKAEQHADRLAALMVTYPSTHGVFEETIRDICTIVHSNGGLVYMDGANMNAMVGLCRPGDIGADVCHLNLHKTFAIPHGGGGPGMGPIGVVARLAPFLPSHPIVHVPGTTDGSLGPVSAAPWGSSSILPISWAYIAMLGPDGLLDASRYAILAANYVAKRLEGAYQVLYKGANGTVAHECILDTRPLKVEAGVTVDDIAKRLMDYGFHAPTMSWPVIGTLMVEPTESESKYELDRFIDAMLGIRAEVQAIVDGSSHPEDNALKGAPHTAECVIRGDWDHAYSREQAVFPTAHTRAHKYWPTVRRVDNVWGDKHLVCSCHSWNPDDL